MANETYFKSLEDPLRHFFGRLCIQWSNNDTSCLDEDFPNRKTFETMQYKDFLKLLTKSANFNRFEKVWTLFENYEIEKSTLDELHFIRNLRDKYSHLSGFSNPHSKDQLADLVIIQRSVEALSRFCEENAETNQLLDILDRSIEELIVQVAQVTKPERFDTDGEKQILSSEDRDFFTNTIREITYEVQASSSPRESETNSLNGPVHISEGEFASIKKQLLDIEKKLSPMNSLKGKIEGIEAKVLSNIRDLHSTVDSMYLDLREGDFFVSDNDNDEDGIRNNNELEYSDLEFDDSDGNEVIEDERLTDLENLIEKIQRQLQQEVAKISSWEARDELISLRKRIWQETGEGPSADGLLRKSMIDEFLEYRPSSVEDANVRMKWILNSVSPAQLPYLEDVCSIVSKVALPNKRPKVLRLATR